MNEVGAVCRRRLVYFCPFYVPIVGRGGNRRRKHSNPILVPRIIPAPFPMFFSLPPFEAELIFFWSTYRVEQQSYLWTWSYKFGSNTRGKSWETFCSKRPFFHRGWNLFFPERPKNKVRFLHFHRWPLIRLKNGWMGRRRRQVETEGKRRRERETYLHGGGHPATPLNFERGPKKDGKRETLFSFLLFRFFPSNFRGIFGVHGGCSGAHLEKYMSTMEGGKNTKRECFDLQICFAQKWSIYFFSLRRFFVPISLFGNSKKHLSGAKGRIYKIDGRLDR